MRRENNLFAEIAVTAPETSLHTQRKLRTVVDGSEYQGNISAHAEKTSQSATDPSSIRKHLCKCRENGLPCTSETSSVETSLHTQRKQTPFSRRRRTPRNISAHTEKTRTPPPQFCPLRKHLCMCRENTAIPKGTYQETETSLHVQRKQPHIVLEARYPGNISACAEKTVPMQTAIPILGKHLCMCRENLPLPFLAAFMPETSLHVQRKPVVTAAQTLGLGNISACAEKTS